MSDVTRTMIVFAAMAIVCLSSYVMGWVNGSSAGRKLLAQEQARAAARAASLERIRLLSDEFGDL